jgi:hypothetical protein
MSDQGEPEEVDHDLVLPFIVCKSKGGPYDDDSFSAGFAIGTLWLQLGSQMNAGIVGRFYQLPSGVFRNEVLPQVDLIAMHFGLVTHFEPYDDEWTTVRFTRSEETP